MRLLPSSISNNNTKPKFEDEFDGVMKLLELGIKESTLHDTMYDAGYRSALKFAMDLVNGRLGAFVKSKQRCDNHESIKIRGLFL